MLSGRSAAKLVINNTKKYVRRWVLEPLSRAEPQLLPQGQPKLFPSLTAQPCTPLLIASSPGERGLDWSLRDWAEVCLQTELSIRIQTHPGREGERAVLQLEVSFFGRLVQIRKSRISPCWVLDPSVTGLPGWKRGYVLRKPGGQCGSI